MRANKFFSIGLIAVLALFSVACNDQLIEDESGLRSGSQKITITAESDNIATKAYWDASLRWFWEPGDKVSVLTYASADQLYSTNTKFTMVETSAIDVAHFTGTISGFVTGTANDLETGYIWALYPYQGGLNNPDNQSGVYLSQGGVIKNVVMPGEQVGRNGGKFDKTAAIAATWSTTFAMPFRNAFGGIRFTIDANNLPDAPGGLTKEDVIAVRLRAVDGQPLSGTADLYFDGFDTSVPSDKYPHAFVTDGNPNVIVTRNDGFLPGANNWYYLLTWPTQAPVSKVKVYLYTATHMASFSESNVPFPRNDVGDIANINSWPGISPWVEFPYELETNYNDDKPMAVMVGGDSKTILSRVTLGLNNVTSNCTFDYSVTSPMAPYVSVNAQGEVTGIKVTKSDRPAYVHVDVKVGGVVKTSADIPVYVYNNRVTVNPNTHKQVVFAPGNLHAYNSGTVPASEHALRFTAREAYKCGIMNLYRPDIDGSDMYGYIDLFGWASGEATAPANPNPDITYPLWLNVTTVDNHYPTLTPSTDWAHNAIYNPSTHVDDPVDTWRTLQISEWLKVINNARMYVSGSVPYQFVTVYFPDSQSNARSNDCLLIFPDTYPSGVLPLPSVVRVEDIPEGVSILPLCGVRDGQTMVPGSVGYYWTASKDGDNPYSIKMDKATGEVLATTDFAKHYGLAVRLVKDVQ